MNSLPTLFGGLDFPLNSGFLFQLGCVFHEDSEEEVDKSDDRAAEKIRMVTPDKLHEVFKTKRPGHAGEVSFHGGVLRTAVRVLCGGVGAGIWDLWWGWGPLVRLEFGL